MLIGSRARASQCSRVLGRRPGPFGTEHQRDPRRSERILELRLRFAGQADPPEAGVANFLERAGEVDDPRPRHALERPGRGFGQRPAFGRGVAVLRDDSDRPERRGRAQDRADIMRIGDLVEHQQDRAIAGLAEHVAKPDVLQRLDLDDHALMRRVVRDQPAEVGDVGQGDRDFLRETHEIRRVARCPGAQDLALRIVERRGDGMLSPQSRAVRRTVGMGSLVPGHASANGAGRRGWQCLAL